MCIHTLPGNLGIIIMMISRLLAPYDFEMASKIGLGVSSELG